MTFSRYAVRVKLLIKAGSGMNISKADAIAHLAKWYDASTLVQAVYRSVTGNVRIIGKIDELSSSAIKVAAVSSEMLLYFRDTSEYEYRDVQEPTTETNKHRVNRYPIFIEVTFSNRDRLEVSEFTKD
jgi:hypothetical protein